MIDKKQYDARKTNVLKLLEQTTQYYKNTDNVENERVFEDLYRQVESGEFSIVVVGEFSAGKSTFLNALMGDKYLPSFSGETTATVNFLKHTGKAGSGEGLRVVYNDGTSKSFPDASFDNVEKFATTRGKEVASSIQQVELFLESELLNDDVILVDSPGLNGVREGHRKITEEQIKKSHACIFLFNAQQPGKNSDFEFLERLRGEVNTVLLVLNKIDTINLSEESIESVLQVLADSYRSKFPDTEKIPEIWPVSAQDALIARSEQKIVEQAYTAEEKTALLDRSRLPQFEERLWRFLTRGEKARSELLEPVNRVIALLNKSRKEHEQLIAELGNSHSQADVLAQIDALEEQLTKIGETVENNRRTIKRQIRQSRIAAENAMSKELESIRERHLNKFEHDFINDDDRLLMDNEIEVSLKRFLERLEDDVNNGLASFSLSFQSELESSIQSIIDIDVEDINEELTKLSKPIELGQSDDIGQYKFSLNYQDIEKKRADLDAEIGKLEERLNISELEEKTAIRLTQKKESLEERKRSLVEQKHAALLGMGAAPTAERIETDDITKVPREGMLGTIWGFLVGDKDIRQTKLTTDDSRVKNFWQHQKSVEDHYERMISEVRAELNNMEEKDVDVHHPSSKELNNKLKRMEEQKRQETEEFNNSQQRFFKTQLKKMQDDIVERIDLIRRETLNEMTDRLRSQEKALIPVLSRMIENSLSDKLQRKKQELESKKIALEGSINDKEQQIEYNKQQIEQICALLMSACKTQSELDELTIDTIEQRNLSAIAAG